MILSVEINNKVYQVTVENPLDISIPLDFYGTQPNAFGVEKADSKPCVAGELIGDTRHGGSCNFEQITLIPHCNGTHTECVGHITNERISVQECLKDAFILSKLISVEPEKAFETDETYVVELNENDRLITRKSLENGKWKMENGNVSGLIIRTIPNSENKLNQTYLDEIPPFFSNEAMQFINEIGVKHLLVDLPSIDRINDEGKLSNHRIFWNVEQGKFEINEKSFVNKTITELIYVPDEIEDGLYLLNLQIAPFVADASPSRPLIFKIEKAN
ncbi:MAG: cyclase family protein [Acidobacteriota bacterium]